jgi:hypothetical protein
MWLEFYTTADKRIEPDASGTVTLSKGSTVIMKVMYKNLDALDEDGLINLGLAISYNSTCFTAKDFSGGTWNSTINSNYATGINFSNARADASDCKVAGYQTIRRIYVEYLNTEAELDGTGDPIIVDESGCLTAISFTVDEEFTDKYFCWLDYALTTSDGKSYNMTQLLDYNSTTGAPHFQKPVDVKTQSVIPAGYSITGKVVSYNAKHEITYTLYSEEGGQTEIVVDSGVLVEAESTTSEQLQTQNFAITGIVNGTYKLVISKAAHADFVITNLIVDGADVYLEDSTQSSAATITLGVGDINGDTYINDADQSIILRSNNYSCSNITTAEQDLCDINGDGYVNDTDQSIILRTANYSRSTAQNFTINLSN